MSESRVLVCGSPEHIAYFTEYYEKYGWSFDICDECGLIIEIHYGDAVDGPSTSSGMFCLCDKTTGKGEKQ